MPWLRFHAYGMGLPKTATTSLATMMANYRTGHEAWLDFLADPAVSRTRGDIDDVTFWQTVQRRFVPLRAEMDAVTCHHLHVDVLQVTYPKAKFIVTYRGERHWYRSYGDWISEGTLSLDPADEGVDTGALPADRSMWIKTSEITSRVPDPAESIDMDNVHSNRSTVTIDRFTIADRPTVGAGPAWSACPERVDAELAG